MFERYSEPARLAVFVARYEASAFGSAQIETHHLLLGVMREGGQSLAPYLNPETDVPLIREELVRRFPPVVETPTQGDMPVSNDAARALAYTREEADALGSQTIEPVHMAIALARIQGGVAAEILGRYGMDPESLRALARLSVSSLEAARITASATLEAVPPERFGAATEILSALREPVVKILVQTPHGEFTISFGEPPKASFEVSSAPRPHKKH